MANRKRPIQVKFRVTPEERELIDKRMKQIGSLNMAAYLRKMAIDGYVVKLELPELREMVSLLRRSSNNLNQIARRVNSTNRIYDEDMQDMLRTQEKLWASANAILEKWNANGWKTMTEIEAGMNAEREKREGVSNNKKELGNSFDTDDFFEAALQRGFRERSRSEE